MKASSDVALIRRPVEWRPVPGYEGIYSITRDGRVWAHQRIDWGCGYQRIFKAKWIKSNAMGLYRGTHLYRDGQRRNCYLHHLVMAAWGPPQPSPLHEINHIDLDRTNNAITNLEWLTRAENHRHAAVHGSKIASGNQTGSANRQAKLTEAQVIEIRARYTGKRGEQSALAREFGISTNYTWAIVNRIVWKHI